jgi:heme-degrading monooxygenase HmoA
VYAALTTTKGSTEDPLGVGAVVGDAMHGWLSEMEGFEGLLMLVEPETDTTLVFAFWESEEVAERQRHARRQFRDRITATVNVEVQETVGYEVAFARLKEL